MTLPVLRIADHTPLYCQDYICRRIWQNPTYQDKTLYPLFSDKTA
jgi:hypothetical protein